MDRKSEAGLARRRPTATAPRSGSDGWSVVVSQEDRDYDGPRARGSRAVRARAATRLRTAAGGTDALDATAAVRCVTQAFDDQQAGTLTRLIQARFEGEEAYIAVYLEGPAPVSRPTPSTVWVASSDDCVVLSFARARI